MKSKYVLLIIAVLVFFAFAAFQIKKISNLRTENNGLKKDISRYRIMLGLLNGDLRKCSGKLNNADERYEVLNNKLLRTRGSFDYRKKKSRHQKRAGAKYDAFYKDLDDEMGMYEKAKKWWYGDEYEYYA